MPFLASMQPDRDSWHSSNTFFQISRTPDRESTAICVGMREHDTPLIEAARHGCAVDVAAVLGGGAPTSSTA